MIKLIIMSSIALVTLTTQPSWSHPSVVYIIRHAEKPTGKSPDLSPDGYKRAKALVNLFDVHSELAIPQFMFAAQYLEGHSSNRCPETLTPLSKHLKLPLQTPYLTEDYQSMADEILTNPIYSGKVVMIAWTHTYIVQLASALGSSPAKKWDANIFDKIWILTFHGNGSVTSEETPQNVVLPK